MAEVVVSPGEPVLVALVNTRSQVGDAVHDELEHDDTAAAWLRAHGGSGDAAEIADVRRARAVLAGLIRGTADGGALAPWLDTVRRTPRLDDRFLDWVTLAPAASAVSVRAILEWAALQTPAGSRVRACASPDCLHVFVDHSKANVRKWCQMAVCGNRTKARRHYARTQTP
jgi:predicted RNA-binding Zn ribbon-like protein